MFYIFCSFTLLVCGEKNILLNLNSTQEPEPGVFGSLEPEPLEKNQEPETEPLGKKIRSRSRSRLKKKSGAGAAKKFAVSPALKKGQHYWTNSTQLTLRHYFQPLSSTHSTFKENQMPCVPGIKLELHHNLHLKVRHIWLIKFKNKLMFNCICYSHNSIVSFSSNIYPKQVKR